MTEKTSSGAGATPPSDTGAMPTPASGGRDATSKPTTTLEEALARIAELERHSANKEDEAKRHGGKLTAAEKELAAYKEKERQGQEAALSEAQRLEKRALEAEQQLQQYKDQLITAQVQLAAQKKGIIDAELAALAVQKSLEFGEDGMPSNLEKALDDLIKNKPFLVAPKPAAEGAPPTSPAQSATPPARETPAIPAMNPGRSQISPPTQLPPGQITRLSDVYKRP